MESKKNLICTETWSRISSYSSVIERGTPEEGDSSTRPAHTNVTCQESCPKGRDTNKPFHWKCVQWQIPARKEQGKEHEPGQLSNRTPLPKD